MLEKQAVIPQTRYIRWVPNPAQLRVITKIHTFLYVATRGLIGRHMDGLEVLLLNTIGKSSGLVRCVALPFFRSGGRYLLVASYGGNAKNPAWVGNIAANPRVSVQLGGERWSTDARIAQGDERDRYWHEITAAFPRYAVYQTKTERKIPIIVIDPAV